MLSANELLKAALSSLKYDINVKLSDDAEKRELRDRIGEYLERYEDRQKQNAIYLSKALGGVELSPALLEYAKIEENYSPSFDLLILQERLNELMANLSPKAKEKLKIKEPVRAAVPHINEIIQPVGLKPCAFCGGKSQALPQERSLWLVRCLNCQAQMRVHTNFEEQAVATWNTRLPHEENTKARLLNNSLLLNELLTAAQEFCRRVEAGEVKSKKTYATFKNLLINSGWEVGSGESGK